VLSAVGAGSQRFCIDLEDRFGGLFGLEEPAVHEAICNDFDPLDVMVFLHVVILVAPDGHFDTVCCTLDHGIVFLLFRIYGLFREYGHLAAATHEDALATVHHLDDISADVALADL
jgi:hypothetical protein